MLYHRAGWYSILACSQNKVMAVRAMKDPFLNIFGAFHEKDRVSLTYEQFVMALVLL